MRGLRDHCDKLISIFIVRPESWGDIPCYTILSPYEFRGSENQPIQHNEHYSLLPKCAVRAAAISINAWTNVADINHLRLWLPILSPIRPRLVPSRKLSRLHNACLSGIWNPRVAPGWKVRARATPSCATLPLDRNGKMRSPSIYAVSPTHVWNPHLTDTEGVRCALSLDLTDVLTR
jgi:hypothetical protein